MTDAIFWPREALRSLNFRLDPAPRNLRGPASVEGLSQVGASDAGIWLGAFEGVAVMQRHTSPRGIELWHAIAGLLEGILTPIIIPVKVSGRRPLPDGVTDGDIDCEPALPFSDDALFDDDSGFETLWIDVTLSASAARRATEISLTKTVCGEIAPGMRFSVDPGDWQARPVRLYQVKRIVSQDNASATFKIWPPLREALTSGQRFEFARPYIQMRLASDREMDLTIVRRGTMQFPTVNFIEDL